MRVRIYDCDEAGNETLRCECELGECFPDHPMQHSDEYYTALNELKKVGRYWTGGGEAPLVMLMRV
jgi:hypothetical protein